MKKREFKIQKLPRTIRNDLLSEVRERTHEKDQDCMIVALGPRGHGKSTAMMELQFEYSRDFSLERVGWSFEEHKRKCLLEIPSGQGYHADEIRFHKMDFRTSLGVEVDKFLSELRPFNLFTTWCGVRIHKILGTFLEYAHYLFYFYDVGECVVLKRNDKILVGNAFGITKDIEKIRDDRTFEKYFVRPAKKAGTYYGRFKFPQFTKRFTPEIYEEYKKLRLKSTIEEYTGEKKFKIPPKMLAEYFKRGKEVGVTHAQLAHIFQCHPNTVAYHLRKA